MTTKIVGFQSGHDVSYCILENGIPVLVEEWERFSRKKLEEGDGLKFFFSRRTAHKNKSIFNKVKHFTFGNPGARGDNKTKLWSLDTYDNESDKKMNKILQVSGGQFWEFGHHLCHAANAFFTSNFNRSLIIAMDGGGFEKENVWTEFAIYEGVDNKIYEKHIFPPHISLGTPWSDLTGSAFGLSTGYPKGDQAGTVMAMAALGEPKYINLISDYLPNLGKLKLIVKSSEQEKFNVAASLQEWTEKTFKNILSEYVFDHDNICLSGGVSLNCVMLAKIKGWFPHVKNLFCDPVPYDTGIAIGSARYLWHHVMGNPRIKGHPQNVSPYLGKSYSKEDIDFACRLHTDEIKITKSSDDDILDKLFKNKVVAVFGGGSETGRRALGNRSILANPINKVMKAHINGGVKHREWFRPLSPSILEEKVSQWFTEVIPSPYMSFALTFRPEKASQVPAVVHYDGTARLQTVNKLLSPWFHQFLTKWEKISGVPILLNTSFNDNEPIVETPEHALSCFLKTQIDFLYFFDYGVLIEKKNGVIL